MIIGQFGRVHQEVVERADSGIERAWRAIERNIVLMMVITSV
jgi:hypothetical protein